MLDAFFTLFAATILWVIPWFPYGLSIEDYNSNISLLIGLMILATTAAFASIFLRETSRRIEQSFMAWSNITGEISDWNRRKYFLERIVLECSRAQSDHGSFAVFSLRVSVQPANGNENVSLSIQALERFAGDYDCFSSLGPNEVGLIALGLQDREAKARAQQLVQAVVDGFAVDESRAVDINAGWAVYGKDAEEASALVGIARERLMRESQIDSTRFAEPREADPSNAA